MHSSDSEQPSNEWGSAFPHSIPHLGLPPTVIRPEMGTAEIDEVVEAEAPPGVPSPPLPLMRWRSTLQEIDESMIERFVRQIGGALNALHELERVHLEVNPGAIFVLVDAAGTPDFYLDDRRGIESFSEKKDIAVKVDPFYAPPEAIGQTRFETNSSLRAWVWWSFGRTLQTVMIRGHVLSRILKKNLDEQYAEYASQAELLTTERLSGVVHAGAVEAMGLLPDRLNLILRGLLTYSSTARWSWLRLEQWLEGGDPPVYYSLSRNSQLFVWRDHGYTIPDAAEAMARSVEHWSEGIDHIFNHENKDSLAAYVASPRGDAMCARKLEGIVQLADSSTFANYPRELVREVVGAVALMILSTQSFRWRGEPLTAERIRERLQLSFGFDEFTAFEIISRPKIIQQIRSFDDHTSNLLNHIGRTADEVQSIMSEHHRVLYADPSERVRIWLATFRPVDELKSEQEALREQFIRCDRPHLDGLLKSNNLSQAELIVLTLTAKEPNVFGYVSKIQDAKKQRDLLMEEGEKLKEALFWLRLGKAAHSGFLLIARLPVWITLLTIFSLFGLIAKPGPAWALFTLVAIGLITIARTVLQRTIAALISTTLPHTRPWGWKDGSRRCRAEAMALTGESIPLRVLNQINLLNRNLAKLTILDPPPKPITPPPQPVQVWTASILSWIILGSLFLFYTWAIVTNPPSVPKIRIAWHMSPTSETVPKEQPTMIALGEADGTQFESTLPGEAPIVDLGLSQELQYAVQRGKELAKEWRREFDGTTPIAVRLPGLRTVRIVLYDPKTQSLVDEMIYEIEAELPLQQISTLGGTPAIYFGR